MTKEDIAKEYPEIKKEVMKALIGTIRTTSYSLDYEEVFSNGFFVFYERFISGKIKNFTNIKGLIYLICIRKYNTDFRKEEKSIIGYTDTFIEAAIEDEISIEEDINKLEQLISELPRTKKTILKASFNKDCTDKELAEELGVTYKTIRSARYKAMKYLKQKLTKSSNYSY